MPFFFYDQKIYSMNQKPFFVYLLLSATVLLFLCGCGNEPDAIDPLPANARILAFGDSLTYGTGTTLARSYPTVLAELTGFEVINSGIPGEVSSKGLRRLPDLLDEIEPDLLILVHGGNDMLQRLPRQETEQNLLVMIQEARTRMIPVIMLGVPEMGLRLSAAPIYKKIAHQEQIHINLDILSEILGDSARKSDRIHPNAQGYTDMAQAVRELLRESGAVE